MTKTKVIFLCDSGDFGSERKFSMKARSHEWGKHYRHGNDSIK